MCAASVSAFSEALCFFEKIAFAFSKKIALWFPARCGVCACGNLKYLIL